MKRVPNDASLCVIKLISMALQRKCHIRKRVPSLLWGVHENKIPESKKPLLHSAGGRLHFFSFEFNILAFGLGSAQKKFKPTAELSLGVLTIPLWR